jgi:hypothetical protein
MAMFNLGRYKAMLAHARNPAPKNVRLKRFDQINDFA